MQINKINTYNSNYNNNNVSKQSPSFGKLLTPDFSYMAADEIKAFTNSIPELNEMAKNVNIKISSGIRMIKAVCPCGAAGRKPIKAYGIRFSELGSENKTLWQKFKGIFTKDRDFLAYSDPTVYESNGDTKNIDNLEYILKEGVAKGKTDYRRCYSLDEQDAIKEAEAKLSEFENPPVSTKHKGRKELY